MAYQALYRKWRPQRFEDIAGQEAVTRTLKNALVNGQLSHAYLFTGPRGTGKTSAAKIVAKAVNCAHTVDGEPCNECEICRAITEGSLGDVIEIDAASNNGVEEIRDIRDKARYAPTQAKYKVYIIDEVHMLSTGAFNALLKTLEEPPQNVIFILATTEPHKIPATIISRTQRFDFRKITQEDIIQRMKFILNKEEIEYEDDALTVIARAANGGMRDALSLLDQVISFGNGKVSFEQAIQVSGSLTQETMMDYITALLENRTEDALTQLEDLMQAGKEPSRFIDEMIDFARDILVSQQTMQIKDELVDIQQFISTVDTNFLYHMIDRLHQSQQEMRVTSKPMIALEVFTIQMSQSNQSSSQENVEVVDLLNQLQKQIDELQRQIEELKKRPTVTEEPSQATNAVSNTSSYKPNMKQIYRILDKATKGDLMRVRDIWIDLLSILDPKDRAIMNLSEPVAASEEGFVLRLKYEFYCQVADSNEELHRVIQNYCQRTIQYPGVFVSVLEATWPTIRKEYLLEKRKKQEEESVSGATEEIDLLGESDTVTDEKINQQPEKVLIDVFGAEAVNIVEE